MKKEDREFWKGIYMLATVGMNVVAGTFIGLLFGWLIDHKLFPKVFHVKTEPWFTLIFLLLGIIAGFKNMFQILKKEEGVGEEKDRSDKEGK